jgi:2-dehydro-3-deoxyphosphogluconate aldolase / (4S)-4-hydroxy-2-oxoglutarate aldolase
MVTKEEVSKVLLEAGMIPVFYHHDSVLSQQIVEACYKGGAKAFEFTNRGENAIAVFKALRLYIDQNKLDILLGAGTIMNENDAQSFTEAGADFLVSPILSKAVASYANNKKMYWIPGCGTLTEIAKALSLGAEIIKIFPGGVLGPDFVSAVKGPMPNLKLMPTGGVELTEENLSSWYKSGVVCVGMGSNLVTKDIVMTKDFEKLELAVKQSLEIIKKYKK